MADAYALIYSNGSPLVVVRVQHPFVHSAVLDRYADEYAMRRDTLDIRPIECVEIRGERRLRWPKPEFESDDTLVDARKRVRFKRFLRRENVPFDVDADTADLRVLVRTEIDRRKKR